MSRVERHAAEEAAFEKSEKLIEEPETAVRDGESGGGEDREGRKAQVTPTDEGREDRKAPMTPTDEGREGRKAPMTPAGKVMNFIGVFIMCAAVLFCAALAAPRLLGLDMYVVISGSMEPSIPVGSLVYSKKTDPKTLTAGDVIVFYSRNLTGAGTEAGSGNGEIIPVTHRVVENDSAKGEIVTKGDANEHNDLSPVTYNNVLGKVVLHIRSLGYIAGLFSSVMGKVAAVLVILSGYLLSEAGNRMRRAQ